MMIQVVLSNPSHPEYGVVTLPFSIPRDQYAHCMELLAALEIGDALKTDCKVEKIDSFYAVLKRAEMLTVNVEELNYLAKRLEDSQLPNEVDVLLDMEYELSPTSMNWQRQRMGYQKRMWESWALWSCWQSQSPRTQIKNLAEHLDLFDFAPGAHTPQEYGKYMIRQSGRFDYDENLDDFMDYESAATGAHKRGRTGCSPTGVTSPIRAISAWKK